MEAGTMSEAYWSLGSDRRRWGAEAGLAEYLALEFPNEDPAWRPSGLRALEAAARGSSVPSWVRRWLRRIAAIHRAGTKAEPRPPLPRPGERPGPTGPS